MLSDRELNVSAQKRSARGWERTGESRKCLEEGVEGKCKMAYRAGRFWKGLWALEKQVNPAPWLLYGADVIWLCIKAFTFSSFVQSQDDITSKHKNVPLCCSTSPAGCCHTSHSSHICPSFAQKCSLTSAECKTPLFSRREPFGKPQTPTVCGSVGDLLFEQPIACCTPQQPTVGPLQLISAALQCCQSWMVWTD